MNKRSNSNVTEMTVLLYFSKLNNIFNELRIIKGELLDKKNYTY